MTTVTPRLAASRRPGNCASASTDPYGRGTTMKHLIVGAGATFGEARALGNVREACPPLIRDFARKTWSNYTPHPILEVYLRKLGHQSLGPDPRELFYELEEKGETNIERFMEVAWENRSCDIEVGEDLPPGYISG